MSAILQIQSGHFEYSHTAYWMLASFKETSHLGAKGTLDALFSQHPCLKWGLHRASRFETLSNKEDSDLSLFAVLSLVPDPAPK